MGNFRCCHIPKKIAFLTNARLRFVIGNVETEPPVKFSKFCSLRPSHIQLVNITPLDQCFCLYHTNFISCCDAINGAINEFPKYDSKLERLVLCDQPKKLCWLQKCSKCPNVKNQLTEMMDRSGKKTFSVSITKWIKDNDTNRFKKVVQQMTLQNLVDHFVKLLPEFLKHVYIKRTQSIAFEKDCEEVTNGDGRTAVLQVDFAENFICEAQEEIQSANWNQATV